MKSQSTTGKQCDVNHTLEALCNEGTVQKYSSAYPFIWDTKGEGDCDPVKMVSTSNNTLPGRNPKQIPSLSERNSSQTREHQTTNNTVISVQGRSIHDDYIDMPDFNDLLEKWLDNDNSSNNDEILAIAEGINQKAMEETKVGSNNLQNEHLGHVASADDCNAEKQLSDEHDLSSLHNNCQSDEIESVRQMKSVTPLHLDNETSFLFAQPYFPGNYSPALWNRQITQNVHLNITSPVPGIEQSGQKEVKNDYHGSYYVPPKIMEVHEKGGECITSNDTSVGISQMEEMNSHTATNIQIAEETRDLADSSGCLASSFAVN